MKRLLPVVVVVLGLGCATSGANNMLSNGGFEEMAPTGVPAGWQPLPSTFDAGEAGPDGSVVHSGSCAMRLEVPEAMPAPPPAPDRHPRLRYAWVKAVPEFVPGEEYAAKAWVRTQDVTAPPVLLMECLSETGTVLATATTEKAHPITGTRNWTRIRTRVRVPKDASQVRILVGAPNGMGGQVWFDDVWFGLCPKKEKCDCGDPLKGIR